MCRNTNHRFENYKNQSTFIEQEHYHAANNGSIGAMKIKQIIKEY